MHISYISDTNELLSDLQRDFESTILSGNSFSPLFIGCKSSTSILSVSFPPENKTPIAFKQALYSLSWISSCLDCTHAIFAMDTSIKIETVSETKIQDHFIIFVASKEGCKVSLIPYEANIETQSFQWQQMTDVSDEEVRSVYPDIIAVLAFQMFFPKNFLPIEPYIAYLRNAGFTIETESSPQDSFLAATQNLMMG